MRSFFRVVLPATIIIGLAGGLSYVLQYTPPAPPPPPNPVVTSNEPSLLIPERNAIFDPNEPFYLREIELGTLLNVDFWVTNPHAVPATVILRSQSCPKCTKLEFGIVDADTIFQSVRQISTLSVAHAMLGQPGFDPSGLALATVAIQDKVTWHPLTGHADEQGLKVPPRDPRLGLQFGIMRFKIDANTPGPVRSSADINFTGGNIHPAEARFEVPVNVVSPVQLIPNQIKLGDVTSGYVQKIPYYLWTSTRDTMPVDLPELPDDPTFVFSKPQPLTPAQCRELGYRLPIEYPTQPPTRIRAAYLVELTIHENYNGQMMELGPFSRKLVFNRGTPFETIATITGSVRGDIRVEGKGNDDQINLGTFRADVDLSKIVLINSLRPNLKLKITSVSPDYLKATLKERPGPTGGYELKLEIPANSLNGPLPTKSSVILELGGATPRRVRIPVSGIAFIQ